MRIETVAVHAAFSVEPSTGAVAPPIHLSTTFGRDEAGRPLAGHTYVRESNPTQDLLEEALARLEGGEAALAFGSGMAAGLAIARALALHPAVSKVNYPGLPGHPGHEIARRQMSAFGSMISFHVGAGREAAIAAVGRARLFTRATSLGGVESLVEHRATSEGPDSTAPGDLVRLSIGLEHPDDLLADLAQALGA
jgi:cystathionine beta-lyase/cystathionine gamma-synthase